MPPCSAPAQLITVTAIVPRAAVEYVTLVSPNFPSSMVQPRGSEMVYAGSWLVNESSGPSASIGGGGAGVKSSGGIGVKSGGNVAVGDGVPPPPHAAIPIDAAARAANSARFTPLTTISPS